MKRIISFALVMLLVLISPANCLASGFITTDIPAEIELNYCKWAMNYFGIADFDAHHDGYIDGNDDCSIVDDLTILDDRKKEIIQYVKLDYLDKDKDEKQQALRAKCMFAAIEYGNPEKLTDLDKSQAIEECDRFFEKLNDILHTPAELTVTDNAVAFYQSDRFTYMVVSTSEEKTIIYIGDVPKEIRSEVSSKSTTKDDPLTHTQNWKQQNGYDFPIYGATSVDLSPISDYLSILESNRIYLKLPELGITHQDECEWIYSQISDDLCLRYIYYLDGSCSSLMMQVPNTYRPKDKALILLMVSFLSLSETEATRLYEDLQYNVVNQKCMIETNQYTLTFYEPRLSTGELAGFVGITVEKY